MRRSRRTIASVLSNPKRRHKAPKSIRRNRRKGSKRSRRKMSARRRNPSRKAYAKAKRRADRRTFYKAKRRKGKRRNPVYKLSSRKKGGWKKVRRNKGRRKSFRKSFRNGSPIAPVAKLARKLPVVGAPLGTALMSLPAGIVAGATVELPIQITPWAMQQSWIPQAVKDNEWLYFTSVGALSGAVLATALKATGMSRSLPSWLGLGQIAMLATAAASGAGYAKMRSRQLANAAGIPTPEQQADASGDAVAGLGQLVVNGKHMGALTADLGMGPAYAVSPGGYGYGRMGALVAAGA